MTNGLRLQRHAASNQRENNRLLRCALVGHGDDPVPEFVSVGAT